MKKTVKTKTKILKETSPISVGNSVLIRCVTMYYTGRIVSVSETEIILEDAAWIASTGRFGAALLTGVLDEIEPYPDKVSVSRGSLLDVTVWRHALPRETR